jgi:hypothetical protein
MAKVMENEAAVAALAVTRGSRLGDVASASNVPDLDQARVRGWIFLPMPGASPRNDLRIKGRRINSP